MTPIEELLRNLARADVTEVAMAGGCLPCVKIGTEFRPVDDRPLANDAILGMLVAAGGSRYIDSLNAKPTRWYFRVEGLGQVSVRAVLRDDEVQVRFVLSEGQVQKRDPGPVGTEWTGFEPANEAPRPSPASPPGPPPESTPALLLAPMRAAAVPAPTPPLPDRPALETEVSPAASGVPAALAPGGTPELDALLDYARRSGASDLHVVAGRPPLLRVLGELRVQGDPIDAERVERIVMPRVLPRAREVLERDGSCDFAMAEGPLGRFRVNVARQRTGLKASIRLVPLEVPTLDTLGLPPDIGRATHHHQGLIVITGPAGHGKTATLAAVVDIINRETTHHIITVEDPIEHVHPRKRAMMSQREVGNHTRSFQSALKGSLREDPDVIVVGELRDTETVRMALAASETGHLVIGTMNTPSAAKTIDRLIDLFPPSDQQQVRMTLAGGLRLIVSQRLLASADGSRMIAAAEVLPGSVPLWNLIRENKTFQIPSLQQRGKGLGIVRLDDSIAELVLSARITLDAALCACESPEELEATVARSSNRAAVPSTHAEEPKVADAAHAGTSAKVLFAKAGSLFGRKGNG